MRHAEIHTPEHGRGLDTTKAEIVFFAVPRSASVIIYDLLTALAPFGGIVYTHAYVAPAPGAWVICSFRDFRDTAVSHWRYRCDPPAGQVMTESEVRLFGGRHLEFAAALDLYQQFHQPTYIRYEQHKGRPRSLIDMLRAGYHQHFGCEPSSFLQDRAERYLNIEASRRAQDAPGIHRFQRRHVGKGTIGQWAIRTTYESRWLLQQILRPALVKWDYPIFEPKLEALWL